MSHEVNGTGLIRVACSNLAYGGVSGAGDTACLDKTMALREWQPHVVLLQEVTARVPESTTPPMWDTPWEEQARVRDERATAADEATITRLKDMAAELRMTPLLGPPCPMMFSRMHTAVMITTDAEVIQVGPDAPIGSMYPAWTEAVVRLPGMRQELAVYSVHLPARSATAQRLQAEWLASIVAQRGRHAIIGGDWNCVGRADMVTKAEVRAMSPHLRAARTRRDSGNLSPEYAVEDMLTTVGLRDAAAALPVGQREPRSLSKSGCDSRVDRFYVTGEVVTALRGYRQLDTGGSDHQALMLNVDLAALNQAEPPGPRP